MFKQLAILFYRSGLRWWQQKHGDSAAALAFFSLFSIAPLLMLIIQIASFIVGTSRAEQELMDRLTFIAGDQIAEFAKTLISNSNRPLNFSLSSATSLLVLFFTASKVVEKLRLVLDSIFGEADISCNKTKLLKSLIGRLIAIGLVLTTGLIIAATAFIQIALKSVRRIIDSHFPDINPTSFNFSEISTTMVAFLLLTTLITAVLKWLPSRPPELRWAIAGACFSTVCFLLLEKSLGLYFQFASFSGVFSSGFTLILLLFWIYFAMQILLFGAEFTRSLQQEFSNHVRSS